jgi:hypothetical protein
VYCLRENMEERQGSEKRRGICRLPHQQILQIIHELLVLNIRRGRREDSQRDRKHETKKKILIIIAKKRQGRTK